MNPVETGAMQQLVEAVCDRMDLPEQPNEEQQQQQQQQQQQPSRPQQQQGPELRREARSEDRREDGREADGSEGGRRVRAKFFDARECWEEEEQASIRWEVERDRDVDEGQRLRDASGRVAAVLSYEVVRDHYALGAYFDVTVQSGRFF
jgi:hypothetical protein